MTFPHDGLLKPSFNFRFCPCVPVHKGIVTILASFGDFSGVKVRLE